MTDSGQSNGKRKWRVVCLRCSWAGYRRQRLKEHAETDSCPQCGDESVHARPARTRSAKR